MNKLKKLMVTMTFVLASAFVFAGCGNNDNDNRGNTGASETTQESTQAKDNTTDNTADDGTKDRDDMDDAKANGDDNTEGVGGELGDAVKDVGDAAKDAADDVADGVGDAVDNLGGGSFDSYEEAKTYLLDKLKKDNASATYEVREETKDLTAYNTNDSGAEGYKFSVYETDGNEKIGIYYVDKDTGKIYRYMGKNSIEAY